MNSPAPTHPRARMHTPPRTHARTHARHHHTHARIHQFRHPTSVGWADVLINFYFVSPANVASYQHICELQLCHSKLMLSRKDLGGHGVYSSLRSMDELLAAARATKLAAAGIPPGAFNPFGDAPTAEGAGASAEARAGAGAGNSSEVGYSGSAVAANSLDAVASEEQLSDVSYSSSFFSAASHGASEAPQHQ